MLSAIRDAFDFAQLGDDMLKSIEAGSKQAQILTDMLKEVRDCGEFIQRYANDHRLCTSPSPLILSTIKIFFENSQGNGRPKILAVRLTRKYNSTVTTSFDSKKNSWLMLSSPHNVKWQSFEMLVRRSNSLPAIHPTTSTQLGTPKSMNYHTNQVGASAMRGRAVYQAPAQPS